MLKERLLIGILGAVFACVILLSEGFVIGIAVSVIVVWSLSELYNAFGFFKKNIPLAVFGYLVSFLVLLMFVYSDGVSAFNYAACLLLLFVYVCVLLIYMVLSHPKTTFSDVSVSVFSIVYVVFLLSHLILIRKSDNGRLIIWVPFIIAWLSDTMAYTFGLIFGKHKLIPAVSPKKTVEGAIGGVLGGAVFMLIYGIICSYAIGVDVNYINMIFAGISGSVLSQFGDLAASCIKREHNIKDFGTILPGHGGILDRFDSVVVAAPFVYYFITVFPLFK